MTSTALACTVKNYLRVVENLTADLRVDENGEKMNFNSMIDAVNYLAKLGWELILAYPVTPTQGMSKDPVYHYILCKKVTSDEQIKEGINLKDK